jgi:hypothetical protein
MKLALIVTLLSGIMIGLSMAIFLGMAKPDNCVHKKIAMELTKQGESERRENIDLRLKSLQDRTEIRALKEGVEVEKQKAKLEQARAEAEKCKANLYKFTSEKFELMLKHKSNGTCTEECKGHKLSDGSVIRCKGGTYPVSSEFFTVPRG